MTRLRQLRGIGRQKSNGRSSKILTIPVEWGQIDDYVELEIIDSNNLLITIVDVVDNNEYEQEE